MPHPLITVETLSRLDRHRVTMRVLLAAVVERAKLTSDAELVALLDHMARVEDERGHLLEGVMEALAEEDDVGRR